MYIYTHRHTYTKRCGPFKVRNGEITAWRIFCLQNVHPKCDKPSLIFLSGSTTWNHSIRHAQPLYICSDFYRWGRFMHLTTVKLSFSAYLLFVISCFINAILHVEVVEWEILHSATSGPINSIGVRANTADSLEDCDFFFFSPSCL